MVAIIIITRIKHDEGTSEIAYTGQYGEEGTSEAVTERVCPETDVHPSIGVTHVVDDELVDEEAGLKMDVVCVHHEELLALDFHNGLVIREVDIAVQSLQPLQWQNVTSLPGFFSFKEGGT